MEEARKVGWSSLGGVTWLAERGLRDPPFRHIYIHALIIWCRGGGAHSPLYSEHPPVSTLRDHSCQGSGFPRGCQGLKPVHVCQANAIPTVLSVQSSCLHLLVSVWGHTQQCPGLTSSSALRDLSWHSLEKPPGDAGVSVGQWHARQHLEAEGGWWLSLAPPVPYCEILYCGEILWAFLC